MEESSKSRSSGWKIWVVIILLPLIAGILLSLLVPRPILGVIYFGDDINATTAKDLIAQLSYARDTPDVRGVVIILDSPGGTVTDTESVYMELNRLRETKPIVTMVEGMAASGAFYMSVGTDYVFAKPSSLVGNIGVIGYLPDPPFVMESIYSTGPYKMWGSPRDTYVREIDMLKQGFLQAVLLGRGNRLKTTQDVILRGQIWPGADGLRLGLIDELGAQSQAYDKAASLAKISHYRVENLRDLAGLPEPQPFPFYGKINEGITAHYPTEPGLYYLYIPFMEDQP